MRRAHLGGRRNVGGGTSEVVAVTEGGGRRIICEAPRVALILAWWKKEWVAGRGILETKGVGYTSGLLGESTMVEIGAKHTNVTRSIV